LSIREKWHSIDAQNRFLIAYPLWFAALFALFYWGKFWSYSPIGEVIDHYQRAWIMAVLDAVLNNAIVDYDIIINPRYHIVITPECNGLIPYFIYLAGVLAYPRSWLLKFKWAILGLIVFNIANIVRLIVVVWVVNRYGDGSFYYIHDIGGNIFLVTVGSFMFLRYLNAKKSS